MLNPFDTYSQRIVTKPADIQKEMVISAYINHSNSNNRNPYAKYYSSSYIKFAPVSGQLKDGRYISNMNQYFNTYPQTARENDYYPYEVVDVPMPPSTEGIHYETVWTYSFTSDKILATPQYMEISEDGAFN